MSCFHPRRVFFTGRRNPETGSKEIIFAEYRNDVLSLDQARRKYPDLKVNASMRLINGTWFLVDSVPVPCGKCEGCKMTSARDWALRCLIESRKYEHNYFLTLTYDDEHCPEDLTVTKRDLQLFLKRLRRFYERENIRYFACGERGTKSLRCHGHMILFNCEIKDLLSYDEDYFESPTISKLWKNGFVLIGPVTAGTCAYVARYTAKKKNRDLGEFLLMSRRPGIGFDYWKDNGDMIADEKLYFYDGTSSKHSIPRYYKYLQKKEDPETAEYYSGLKSQVIDEKINLETWKSGFEDIEEALDNKEAIFKRRDKNMRNKI